MSMKLQNYYYMRNVECDILFTTNNFWIMENIKNSDEFSNGFVFGSFDLLNSPNTTIDILKLRRNDKNTKILDIIEQLTGEEIRRD